MTDTKNILDISMSFVRTSPQPPRIFTLVVRESDVETLRVTNASEKFVLSILIAYVTYEEKGDDDE